MPWLTCWRTASLTASRVASAYSVSSPRPLSMLRIMSSRSFGRGRLPTCVVRTRSLLRFTRPQYPTRCGFRAYRDFLRLGVESNWCQRVSFRPTTEELQALTRSSTELSLCSREPAAVQSRYRQVPELASEPRGRTARILAH